MTLTEPRRDPENAERSRLERYFLQPEGRVLDIGCGDGRLTCLFARRAGLAVGIDVDTGKLQEARCAHPEAVRAKARFAAAAGVAMPFLSRFFNLAIFSWSL